MSTVRDVVTALEAYAPLRAKMSGDNCGLLLGRAGQTVEKALIALDVTRAVVDEAKAYGAQMVITHHPLFFQVSALTDETLEGRNALLLAEAGLAVCCMHTNLDFAAKGVNYALARAVGLSGPYEALKPFDWAKEGDPPGEGLMGRLDAPQDTESFAASVQKALASAGIRLHDAGRPVRHVGLCSGSGGSLLDAALEQGVDTFLTGEVKYNHYLAADAFGLNLIEAGHFETENVICEPLRAYLQASLPGINFGLSGLHKEPYRCL